MSPAPDSRRVALAEIAGAVGGRLVGGDTAITGVSSLEQAGPGDLAYVDGERFVEAARASAAAAFVLGRELPDVPRPQVVVAEPRYAFARVVERFFARPRRPRGIAAEIVRGVDVQIGADASIGAFVTLGDRVRIGRGVTLYPGVFVGDDVVIGDDSILYPHVTVREGCLIGQRVVIHSGAVIGSDG
ncbi:MAG TPA: LpxD N-terminal domain-containing protein, partial [Candidatus Methylomirabilis sp.]|nr:LpxD N-terminal domain-containing protein [Candidatus Methylomirabilis sp.]